MKTTLTWAQTQKGTTTIKNVSATLMGIGLVFLFMTPFIPINSTYSAVINPLTVLMFELVLVIIVSSFVQTVTSVSPEQKQWLSENATRDIKSQDTYAMADFFPEHQYTDLGNGRFKPEQPHDLQTELEKKADVILFQTNAPAFKAMLSTTIVADADVRARVDTPEETTLVYCLPVSDDAFKKWSQEDRAFNVKQSLDSMQEKELSNEAN